MKYLIILLSLFIMSCDVTEPEEPLPYREYSVFVIIDANQNSVWPLSIWGGYQAPDPYHYYTRKCEYIHFYQREQKVVFKIETYARESEYILKEGDTYYTRTDGL